MGHTVLPLGQTGVVHLLLYMSLMFYMSLITSSNYYLEYIVLSPSSKEAVFLLGHTVVPLGQRELLTVPRVLNLDPFFRGEGINPRS